MVTDKTKIYVVIGAGNRGKTTLLFDLVNELVKNGSSIIKNPYNQVVQLDQSVCEYCLLLQYKNQNILIMSKGDNEKELEWQWNNFKDIDVHIDIIIGACRTFGQTVDWWNRNFKNIIQFKNNDKIDNEEKRQEYCVSQLEKLKQKIFG